MMVEDAEDTSRDRQSWKTVLPDVLQTRDGLRFMAVLVN